MAGKLKESTFSYLALVGRFTNTIIKYCIIEYIAVFCNTLGANTLF